ncbi:hypothetical protein EMIT0P228_30418 [Pseudomonas brassicacearum]
MLKKCTGRLVSSRRRPLNLNRALKTGITLHACSSTPFEKWRAWQLECLTTKSPRMTGSLYGVKSFCLFNLCFVL